MPRFTHEQLSKRSAVLKNAAMLLAPSGLVLNTDHLIGSGTFGYVASAVDTAGHTYAVKVMDLVNIPMGDKVFTCETDAMRDCAHIWVCPLLASAATRTLGTIVMPRAAFHMDFAAMERNLEFAHVWYLYRQVAAALLHVQHCGYMHCDVKPTNILVTMSELDDPFPYAMLADFGLAAPVDAEHAYATALCTPGFRALDLYSGYKHKPRNNRGVDAISLLASMITTATRIVNRQSSTFRPPANGPFPFLCTAKNDDLDASTRRFLRPLVENRAMLQAHLTRYQLPDELITFFLRHCGQFTTDTVSSLATIVADPDFVRYGAPPRHLLETTRISTLGEIM